MLPFCRPVEVAVMKRIVVYAAAVVLALSLASSARAQVWGGRYYYNPWTGGAMSSGAAYNPWTGGYHYGGQGYNPWTGRYYGNTAFYNPWTGVGGYSGGYYNPWTGMYGYRYRYW
jgi:hypothetical protein